MVTPGIPKDVKRVGISYGGAATILHGGEGLPCPRCAGTGQCPDCQGKGSQECPVCSGQGTRETSRGISYQCKSCGGQGAVPCPSTCSSCEGTGEITEELQKKVRDRYTPRFANFSPTSQVTRVLLAVCLAMFIAGEASPQFHALTVLNGNVWQSQHYWEFLTFLFQHLGIVHLICNMGFLWSYGPVLEGLLGGPRYLLLYLAGGIASGLFSWFGNTQTSGMYWSVTGASASLFALDGAFLAIYWRWRLLPWDAVRSLTSWAGIILFGGIAAQMNGFHLVDNWSHGGGFLAGFIIAAILPRPRGH